MTREQWLVYLWSIYPNGEFSMFFWIIFIISAGGLSFLFIVSLDNGDDKINKKIRKLFIILIVSLILIFLSNLVPNRQYFAYIVATPYVVDSGKSIVESLQDPNSKLSKLNSIMDKGLDKIINELEDKKTNK